MKKKVRKSYYAVKVGRRTGIFKTWTECEAQVKGFSGALYKGFENYDDALAYLGKNSHSSSANKDEEKVIVFHRVFCTEMIPF